jgi:hypothetical protein
MVFLWALLNCDRRLLDGAESPVRENISSHRNTYAAKGKRQQRLLNFCGSEEFHWSKSFQAEEQSVGLVFTSVNDNSGETCDSFLSSPGHAR